MKIKTIEYVDYLDMRDHIEEKYKIDERDYKKAHEFNYLEAYQRHGVDLETANMLFRTRRDQMTPEHAAISVKVSEEADKYREEHPYCDFWHFMLDYWPEFSKGKPMNLNWRDVYNYAKEDWQKEIAQLYINEFGEKDYTVVVDW